MEIGLFLPIAKNGFIASKNTPQFMPTWELNRDCTLRVEEAGWEFALSMIKFRGFGGPTEYWDYCHDSFTLTAGLATITKRIMLYPSVATLTVHPAVAARMAVTTDHMSGGRFGLNIVSGWYRDEYKQMGLWPEGHHDTRYDYATEYVTILRELWARGKSSFKGKYFQLEDCECKPLPSRTPPLVCAGQSGRGLRFTAEAGDMNFVIGDFDKLQELSRDLAEAARKAGREVGTIALHNVIAAKTDEEAKKRFEYFIDGADEEAIRTLIGQIDLDPSEGMARSLKAKAMFMGLATLVGSYETVAKYLDRLYFEGGIKACMFAFPDFTKDLDDFCTRVLPRMESRRPANRSAVRMVAQR